MVNVRKAFLNKIRVDFSLSDLYMSETLDLRKLTHHDAGSSVPAAMWSCGARVAQTHRVGGGGPDQVCRHEYTAGLESWSMAVKADPSLHPKHGPLL
jgi:hypothetical protein